MAKLTYSEKLKNPKWQKKRLEILQRDNFTCVLCGDKETELHINHLKYTKEPWDATNNDLETLCKVCHKFKHEFPKRKFIKVIKINGDIITITENKIIQLYEFMNDNSYHFVIGFNKETYSILSSMYKLSKLK